MWEECYSSPSKEKISVCLKAWVSKDFSRFFLFIVFEWSHLVFEGLHMLIWWRICLRSGESIQLYLCMFWSLGLKVGFSWWLLLILVWKRLEPKGNSNIWALQELVHILSYLDPLGDCFGLVEILRNLWLGPKDLSKLS